MLLIALNQIIGHREMFTIMHAYFLKKLNNILIK